MSRLGRWGMYVPPVSAAALIVVQGSMWATTTRMPALQVVLFVVTLLILAFAFIDMLIRDLRRNHMNPIGERTAVIGVLVVESVLLFATTYLAISEYDGEIAGMRTPLDAVYFTMTTLMTIGFGDIAAEGQTARAVVLTQMIFTVVLLSSSVRLFTSLTKSIAREHAEAHARAHPSTTSD
ncbi:MAG: hypothetical protein RL134_2161 [Actinomycetota bacterium]|jgi:hypothetical protein